MSTTFIALEWFTRILYFLQPWLLVLAMVGTLIMGVVTAGVSRIFEGLPVLFRPI